MTINIKLAIRSFVRNAIRFRPLVIGIAILVALLILLSSVLNSALQSVEQKAQNYFAGDLTVQMIYDQRPQPFPLPEDEFLEELQALSIVGSISLRTVAYDNDVTIFANGFSSNLRRFTGIEADDHLFEGHGLNRQDTTAADLSEKIFLSQSTAEDLNVGIGDIVLVRLRNQFGAYETVNASVENIFQVGSFFAYNAFVYRPLLNRLLGYPEDYMTELGLLTPQNTNLQDALSGVEEFLLEKGYELTPRFNTREERNELYYELRRETKYSISTVESQLAQLHDFMEYLSISIAIFASLFIIIMIIGITNTFNVIASERTGEIGTMRAIGIKKTDIIFQMTIEALLIAVISFTMGSILVLILLKLISLINFDSISVISIFTEGGFLKPQANIGVVSSAFIASVSACVLGVFLPASKAARKAPVEALRYND